MDVPLGIPSLPLEDAREDKYSENLEILFHEFPNHISAYIYNEDGYIIDVITGHDFIQVYNSVREEYPQAKWDNGYEIS